MQYYPTPAHVVKIIRKHVPINARNILEPAVGEGALLAALSNSQLDLNLTLVDIDKVRLDALSLLFPNHSLINEDFIEWSSKFENSAFDLVLTNPPFSGRNKSWVLIEKKRVPIEVAFILRSIKLLSENGTLLAVVPDSVVNSEGFSWLRKEMLSVGTITYAYQLPEKTFDGIEGAFYVMVYKKSMKKKHTYLIDARKSKGEYIKLSKERILKNNLRFDYSYYKSESVLSNILCNNKSLKLGSMFNIKRGSIQVDYKKSGNIHTSSFAKGYWSKYSLNSKDEEMIFAVKRVSRDAHMSFGILPRRLLPKVTDCIILLEPKFNGISPIAILFNLRVLYCNNLGRNYLLKGAGAKFITISTLSNSYFIDFSGLYKEEYDSYKFHYVNGDYESCLAIEKYVFENLLWGDKVMPMTDLNKFNTMRKINIHDKARIA